jgi:hypothetical protein
LKTALMNLFQKINKLKSINKKEKFTMKKTGQMMSKMMTF